MLPRLALSLTLLSSASLVSAQAAPPARAPAPSNAPAPAAAPQYVQAAPPPNAAYPSAPPQPSAYQAAPPPNGYQSAPPPNGYQVAPPPGVYPAQPPPAGYAPPPQPAPLYQNRAPSSNAPPGYTWRPPARPSRGLMIAGIAILASSYFVATTIAIGIGDESHADCSDCRDIAPYLYIPVVGPFVSMSQTDDDAGLWMLGMVESVGLGLMIGGIVRYKNTKQAAEQQHAYQWQLPGNRLLALDVSAGSRFAGPRMQLDF